MCAGGEARLVLSRVYLLSFASINKHTRPEHISMITEAEKRGDPGAIGARHTVGDDRLARGARQDDAPAFVVEEAPEHRERRDVPGASTVGGTEAGHRRGEDAGRHEEGDEEASNSTWESRGELQGSISMPKVSMTSF